MSQWLSLTALPPPCQRGLKWEITIEYSSNEINFSKSIYFLSDAEILYVIRLATVTVYEIGLTTVIAYLPLLPRTFHNMFDASRRLNLELFYLFHYDRGKGSEHVANSKSDM